MSFKGNSAAASAAGKKGAATVRERLGADWYREMGKKGGQSLKAQRGSDYYRELGRKGGATRWAKEKAREAEGG